MPLEKRNEEWEEQRIQEIARESKEARAALEEHVAEYELRKQIIQARKSNMISQKELSAMTGLTQQVISKIETGSTNPTIGTLIRYLKGIGYRIRIEKMDG